MIQSAQLYRVSLLFQYCRESKVMGDGYVGNREIQVEIIDMLQQLPDEASMSET